MTKKKVSAPAPKPKKPLQREVEHCGLAFYVSSNIKKFECMGCHQWIRIKEEESHVTDQKAQETD